MHIIAEEIRECKKKCFVDLYEDYEYNNQKWSKSEIDSIKPLIYGPENPKILFISQAPSLQAWLNGKNSTSPDGGLATAENNFLINNLLPAFGLSIEDLDIFKDNVFWIHTCNCFPWHREYIDEETGKTTRKDRSPNKTQIKNCLGHWLSELENLDTLKAIILMGKPSTILFPQIYENSETFTNLVRKVNIRDDIISGVEILPIYHQSTTSRTFNNPIDKAKNEEIKSLLNDCFFRWIQ